jgi:hypothetical protein
VEARTASWNAAAYEPLLLATQAGGAGVRVFTLAGFAVEAVVALESGGRRGSSAALFHAELEPSKIHLPRAASGHRGSSGRRWKPGRMTVRRLSLSAATRKWPRQQAATASPGRGRPSCRRKQSIRSHKLIACLPRSRRPRRHELLVFLLQRYGHASGLDGSGAKRRHLRGSAAHHSSHDQSSALQPQEVRPSNISRFASVGSLGWSDGIPAGYRWTV